MQHGDLVILATDGVIDNIFTAEMIQVRKTKATEIFASQEKLIFVKFDFQKTLTTFFSFFSLFFSFFSFVFVR